MNILYALLMGILQGVTEYLPVSSSSLTVMLAEVLSYDEVPPLLMSAVLHIGTLIPILILMRKRIGRFFAALSDMLADMAGNLARAIVSLRLHESADYVRIAGNHERMNVMMIFVSFVPSCVIGFLLRHAAVSASASFLAHCVGFLLTGILLLVSALTENGSARQRDLSGRKAFLTGIAQGVGVLPGFSRLGLMYGTAHMLGLRRGSAAYFAILSSVPFVVGALIYEIPAGFAGITVTGSMIGQIAAALLFSALTGFVVLKAAIRSLRKNRLRMFSILNLLAGIAAAVLYVKR